MRALLVEDNARLVRSLSAGLRAAGLVLDSVGDGLHADHLLQTEDYDVVVLDLALPGIEGHEVLRRLRARGSDVPVLILTASGETTERVRGLNAGADDYLAKPFDMTELIARLRAIARRRAGRAHAVFQIGRLQYDSTTMRFSVGEQTLALPKREHGVLEALITQAGRPVAKPALSAALCSLDDAVSVEAVEIYIHRVRKKLEGSGTGIRTLRGLGYLLEEIEEGPRESADDAPA